MNYFFIFKPHDTFLSIKFKFDHFIEPLLPPLTIEQS